MRKKNYQTDKGGDEDEKALYFSDVVFASRLYLTED